MVEDTSAGMPVTGPLVSSACRVGTALVLLAAASGCGDGVSPTAPTSGPSTATSTTGAGSGGAGSGGTAGSGGHATTTGAAGMGGAGGAAGHAGHAGSGGTGGAAGAPVKCLDPSSYSSLFVIADPAFCAVARYDADEALNYTAPSWGTQGGPLTVRAGAAAGSVALVRWTPPAGPTGALTKQVTEVAAQIPAMGAFLGGQAADLPFFSWTAVSWSGAFPMTAGEVLLIKGAAVDVRYPVNGFYGAAGIPAATGEGRLLYTGLSAIDDATASTNGLYAADSCGTAAAMPRLVPSGDVTCAAPVQVDAWADSSGPVALDRDGNAFVVLASLAGTQEARGYAAASIARGAPSKSGDTLFMLPGFGSSLGAVTPAGGKPGVMVFQPSDAMSAKPLDVVAQRYTVAGTTVKGMQAPAVFLKIAATSPALAVMTDPTDRLWIAGPAGMTGTTYVVLAQK